MTASYGMLYALPASAWNKGVVYLPPECALAFVEVSPGRYLCRPRFHNAWSEAAWREVTKAVEVTLEELTSEIRQHVEALQ